MSDDLHWVENACDMCDRPLPRPYGAICPRCIDELEPKDVA